MSQLDTRIHDPNTFNAKDYAQACQIGSCDEAAFLPEGEDCLNAVLPTGAEIIAMSSARAGWFGDQCQR